MIKSGVVTYKWMSFSEISNILEENKNRTGFLTQDLEVLKKRFYSFPNNPHLTEYKDDPLLLVKDILNNGMYCPFFLGKGMSQKDNGDIEEFFGFLNGTHRLGALWYYHTNIKKIDKKFLVLVLDYPKEVNKILRENPIPNYYIAEGRIQLICARNYEQIRALFDSNGGAATQYAYRHNKSIDDNPEVLAYLNKVMPSKFLNDENLFENLIKNGYSFTDFVKTGAPIYSSSNLLCLTSEVRGKSYKNKIL